MTRAHIPGYVDNIIRKIDDIDNMLYKMIGAGIKELDKETVQKIVDSGNTDILDDIDELRDNLRGAFSKVLAAKNKWDDVRFELDSVRESKSIKSRKSTIKEGKGWALTIPNSISDYLRSSIDNGDLEGVLEGLRACYDFIHENMPDVYDDDEYENDIAEIENQLDNLENYEDYDMDMDDVEGEVDYLLNDFWDLCDGYRIFVSL